jgi:hypothetical protein
MGPELSVTHFFVACSRPLKSVSRGSMHKKIIRGVTYFYTTVRDNGKVKTIYLGKTEDEARMKESELQGFEPRRTGHDSMIPRIHKTPRPFPRTWTYVMLAIVVVAFLFSGNIVGYIISITQPVELTSDFEIAITMQAGEFLPRAAMIEIMIENQSNITSFTLENFLVVSGSGIVLGEGDFYSIQAELDGYGEGYGVKGTKNIYPFIHFRFELSEINNTDNETEIFLFDGSCSFETPYIMAIQDLVNGSHGNYSASLVPGYVVLDNQTINDSYVSMEIVDDMVLADTDYSEIIEGYGEGFTGESEISSLMLSESGAVIPESPGIYAVTVRMVYNDLILNEDTGMITISGEPIPIEPLPAEPLTNETNRTINVTEPPANMTEPPTEPTDSIIGGGSGTMCGDSMNPGLCFYVKNIEGDVVAMFDDQGNIDIRGGLYENYVSLSCSNCFQIVGSENTLMLYIDSVGNLYTHGTFTSQENPSPSGNNDFQIKDSSGTVVGYINGGTGDMYFKGVIHYDSDF